MPSSKKKSSKDFFMEIWDERPHVSEVSGEPLGEEPLAQFFSHVLGKGAHPEFKFDKRNIMLMTFDEHRMWEFGVPPRAGKWEKVYKRRESLLFGE